MDERSGCIQLDVEMADLNLRENDQNIMQDNLNNVEEKRSESFLPIELKKDVETIVIRRSLRKRIQPLSETEKRRVFTKPRKILDGSNFNELKKYYMCKTVKRLPSTLETIFEEDDRNNGSGIISTRKFKRVISFGDYTNIGKVRKRQLKAKKSGKGLLRRKKIPMDVFLTKMKELESDSENEN